MGIPAGTLFIVFVALIGLLFIGAVGASIWFVVWAHRSDSSPTTH